MSQRGDGARERVRVSIDQDVWAQEVGRFRVTSKPRVAADAARRIIEGQGVPRGSLAACEAQGSDGTRLGGCVKTRVPLGEAASAAPWGFVFQPYLAESGDLGVRLLAFGERHPDQPATRSVYARAHHRLHGRWP